MLPIPPLPPFPTKEQFDAYVSSLMDELPGVPMPSDVVRGLQHLYDDLMRFGPPSFPELPELPEIVPSSVGRLFIVEVPAVALPPPPPLKSTFEKLMDCIGSHKVATALVSSAALGSFVYLALHYKGTRSRLFSLRRRALASQRKKKAVPSTDGDREIVIILGVDAVPYGLAIVHDFRKNGYIVIASVFSGEVADELERTSEGYVRALVLDPEEPGSVPHFMRSLSSALSLRYPTTLHGDPYASMSSSQSRSLAQVASVISFLSLGSSDFIPFNVFTSPILFAETYSHQIMTRALTPLSILHSTLPLFKPRLAIGSPSSQYLSRTGGSVILCVPAVARVGVLGSSSSSMATAAVVRGFDVFRRETKLASDRGSGDSIEGARIRFVTVDVGEIGYVPSNIGVPGRKPSDVSVLSSRLMDIVEGSRKPWSWAWIWQAFLGSHRSVGAGARTYGLASALPTSFLDFLLLLPRRLEHLHASLQAIREDQTPSSSKTLHPPPKSPLSPSRSTTSRTKGKGRLSSQPSHLDEEEEEELSEGSEHLPTEAELAAISTTASAAASTGPSAHASETSSIASSEDDGSGSAESRTRKSRSSGPGTIADSWVSVQEDD